MTFTLKIDVGNEGIQTPAHIADRLQQAANDLRSLHTATTVEDLEAYGGQRFFDSRGNTIGRWQVLPLTQPH